MCAAIVKLNKTFYNGNDIFRVSIVRSYMALLVAKARGFSFAVMDEVNRVSFSAVLRLVARDINRYLLMNSFY